MQRRTYIRRQGRHLSAGCIKGVVIDPGLYNMATILLRIQKDNQRESLARVLGTEHEIVVGRSTSPEQGPGEELLILDHMTLQQTGPDALRTYSSEASRSESPVLLLVPTTHTSSLRSAVWDQVDDVVEILVQAVVMKNRVNPLLRLNEHAEEAESFRYLAAKYKVMLEKQQREMEGYKAIFHTQTQGAVVVRDWEIVEANAQAEQLFGRTSLVGESLLHFFPSKQADGVASKQKADEVLRLREGGTKRVDWMFKHSDGQKFTSTIDIHSVPFDGETCLHILFSHDDAGDDIISG